MSKSQSAVISPDELTDCAAVLRARLGHLQLHGGDRLLPLPAPGLRLLRRAGITRSLRVEWEFADDE